MDPVSKRIFDLVVGIPLGMIALPALLVLCVLIVVTSGWPPVIVQTRVGADERPIRVPKLRTMKRGVPVVAKSLLDRSAEVYTALGPFLRRTSLDELPQLWSVVRGDMSLVGPRPALPSQHDLLALRRKHGVGALKPGITGLAQVLGREDLTLSTKVRSEALYARRLSLRLDLLLLAWTVRAVLFGRGAF
jgi:O-antigen biosynthesis protein WbqP